ncbi:hypothetical protein [Alteromonas sp. S015]
MENTLSDLIQQIVGHKSNAEETIYAPLSSVISGLYLSRHHAYALSLFG